MKANQDNRLKELIAGYVLTYNYWGYLFSRIRRRSVIGFPSIMGVGVEQDGVVCLYFEPGLLEKTEDNEIIKVLEHEGMHLLNQHLPRLMRILIDEVDKQKEKNKIEVWNVAADCAVNEQANILDPIMIADKPWAPQLPEKYGLPKKHPTEFYFYELLNMQKVQKIKYQKGFDEHGKWTEVVNQVSDPSALSRKVEGYIQNVVKDSVTSFNKDRGSFPAHISDLINNVLAPPQVPYYQIIKKLIKGTRFSKFQRSPTKINRKRTYVFNLNTNDHTPQISPFPGKTRDMSFNIVLLIDTSGSMDVDDIAEGLSGVKNLIEKDRNCKLTVLEVDAGVEKEYEVKQIRDIQFNVKGRGGTMLFPGLVRAKQLNCDVCLAFTDGYVEDLNSKSKRDLPKKIIWVINKDGTSQHLNRTGRIVQLK